MPAASLITQAPGITCMAAEFHAPPGGAELRQKATATRPTKLKTAGCGDEQNDEYESIINNDSKYKTFAGCAKI